MFLEKVDDVDGLSSPSCCLLEQANPHIASSSLMANCLSEDCRFAPKKGLFMCLTLLDVFILILGGSQQWHKTAVCFLSSMYTEE